MSSTMGYQKERLEIETRLKELKDLEKRIYAMIDSYAEDSDSVVTEATLGKRRVQGYLKGAIAEVEYCITEVELW